MAGMKLAHIVPIVRIVVQMVIYWSEKSFFFLLQCVHHLQDVSNWTSYLEALQWGLVSHWTDNNTEISVNVWELKHYYIFLNFDNTASFLPDILKESKLMFSQGWFLKVEFWAVVCKTNIIHENNNVKRASWSS